MENDVKTLADANELSLPALKELGFSVGVRNRLFKAFAVATEKQAIAEAKAKAAAEAKAAAQEKAKAEAEAAAEAAAEAKLLAEFPWLDARLRKCICKVQEPSSVVALLEENDVKTLADAKALSLGAMKEFGFSVGVRNRLLKAFFAADEVDEDENLEICVGDICMVIGLGMRGDLNGKKARVIGLDAEKGLWHVTVDGEAEGSKLALRPKNLKPLASAV
jgi:hypothetical protein